ncbi:MAG: DNA polymerase III subunit beta [Bacteroidales bacterium]|nr:DNA polymerase III subunit beta [Bacteroidales bacterium]
MKFIVSSTVLLKKLQAISGVISSNNTLPILDDFLFQLNEQELKITASDLETTMTVRLNTDMAENPGEVAIPAKILLDTLKTLADIPVTFNISLENYSIELVAGEGKYKLSGHPSDEFPQTPVLEDANGITVESSLLATAINKTVFATGNDELRPVMTGVFCEFSTDDLTFVATDAHKLVRYSRKDVKADSNGSIILPKKPLNQLKGILKFDDSPVKIEYTSTNAYFEYENISLVCRLIEGKYPNYNAVIPAENPYQLTIDRLPFVNTIKRVSIFANQSTHQIRLKISGQELLLSAEDIDFSNEAKERLACEYEGDDMEIGFNSKFLMEMLNNLETDKVRLEMSAPNRAGILFPVTDKEVSEDILMLVMPVMLNQ